MDSLVLKKELSFWLVIISCLFLSTQVLAETFTVPGDASPESCDNGEGMKFDWRKYDPNQEDAWKPKDQWFCGACWAFAAVATIEDILILNQKRQTLSTEYLISDCGGCDGDCNGGHLAKALNFLDATGTVSAAKYPFVSYYCLNNNQCSNSCTCLETNSCSKSCNYNCPNLDEEKVWKISYKKINPDIKMIKKALKKYGPLAVSSKNWGHDLVLVGYDDCSDICLQKYGKSGCWILQNSWGIQSSDWGLVRGFWCFTLGKYLEKDKTCVYQDEGFIYIPYNGHKFSDIIDNVYAIKSVSSY